MTPRKPVDLGAMIGDVLCECLSSKGRGQHLEPLAHDVWLRLLARLVDADPRLVISPGGTIELAATRDARDRALMREPETFETTEEPVEAERYVVALTAGTHD
jgi:hypothetical protein